jgi:YHS domain-containing protein
LLPRLLLNELLLVRALTSGEPAVAEADGPRRDPVCGMVGDTGAEAAGERHAGRDYVFCSRACHLRFRQRPARYLSSRASGARDNDDRSRA